MLLLAQTTLATIQAELAAATAAGATDDELAAVKAKVNKAEEVVASASTAAQLAQDTVNSSSNNGTDPVAKANSELARVTGSTATSKAGRMSAGAVVGVLFAIIAVVGVGAAVFKFRHKLATIGRKDGGAAKPGLAVTMNTQYETNLADAAGILNAIAARNTTAIVAPTTGNGNGNDDDDDEEALPPNPATAATSNTNNPFFATAVDDTQC